MKLTCPSCSARLSVDLSQIPSQGANILCPRCNHLFFNSQQEHTAETTPGLEVPQFEAAPQEASFSPLPAANHNAATVPLLDFAEANIQAFDLELQLPASPLDKRPSAPKLPSVAELSSKTEMLPVEELSSVQTVPEELPLSFELLPDKPPPRLPSKPRLPLEAVSPALPQAPALVDGFSSKGGQAEDGLPIPLSLSSAGLPFRKVSSTGLPSRSVSSPGLPSTGLSSRRLSSPGLPSAAASSPTELVYTFSKPPSSPSAAETDTPKPKRKTKSTYLKLSLLLGVCLLGFVYVFRPGFLFPPPPQPPPAPSLPPLPEASDMKATLQEGIPQTLREMSALPQVLGRGSVEQALLWCRSVFSLALLGDKPTGLNEALAFMEKLPEDTPHSQEFLKTKAAYALLLKDTASAVEMLTALPEKDGESVWLLAQASLKQNNIPKAVEVLGQEFESFEPRLQKTLGDIAFSMGEYAWAAKEYTKARAHPLLQAEMDLAIADAWLKAHMPEKALEQLSVGSERMDAKVWVLLAHAQLELELYPEAAATLEKLKPHSHLFAEPMARLFVATGDPKKAAALLGEEVRRRPEDLLLANQYVQALLLSSQAAEAENFARRLLQQSPENVSAWLLSATVFQRLGQLESVVPLLEKAFSMEPQNVEVKLQWAALQQKLGKLSEAQSFLEKATAQSPEAAALWVALGALFQETHRLSKAKAAYAQALLKQPRQLEALIGLGRIALTEEDIPQLEAYVEKIKAINPRSPEGAWLEAHLLRAEGKKQEAAEKLEWALRREGNHVEFWLSKARMAMEDKQLGSADEALARARLLNPSLSVVNHLSGLLSEMQGDFNKAQSYFQKAAEADKQNPLHLLAQSRALLSAKRPQEAAALLNRVITQHPSNVQAPLLLGRYYQERYRFKTALPLFEKALAIEPSHVEALRGAADCLLELTQWSQATAMLQRLLKQTPEDVSVIEKLGRAAFEAGHYAQALRWYQKSLEKEPDNAPVLLNLGWVFKELGRKQEAISAFKNYLQLEPLSPSRRMIEEEIGFLRQQY